LSFQSRIHVKAIWVNNSHVVQTYVGYDQVWHVL
jgi:hypothetical protein